MCTCFLYLEQETRHTPGLACSIACSKANETSHLELNKYEITITER